ncbi:MAG: hypothetical protein ABF491_13680 [Acetobacter sp.]
MERTARRAMVGHGTATGKTSRVARGFTHATPRTGPATGAGFQGCVSVNN